MQPHEDLSVKAAALSRSAHPQWLEFLRSLSAYSDKQTENLVNSPASDLQVMQGKAQALKSLVSTLTSAVETADKINRKKPT